MAEKQRESLLRSSISINSIRRTASQFTKSLQRSNTIARGIVKSTKERNLFERSTIAKDNEYFRKRRENIRRKQREDELEASSTTGITKREGTLTAKSTKGFLGRILDFFGIILIGWFVNRLPGILKAIGNVINLIKRATGFLTGFIDGVRDFLGTIGDGIKSALDSFPKFDFVNFKNESDKELEKAANIGQKLDQELFFATREVNDSFEKVYKDNPDLDPNTNELIYPEELEQQMRGDGEGNEQEGEGQENISNEIVSATGINFGDASNVEGMNNTVEGEEIKIADDETNKKIEEAIDKFTTTGEKIGNVDGDEQTKELGKNIEATTDGIGSGASGGSGGGGEVAAANAKSQNVETDNNKSKVDEKEEEIQEDEIVGEKGEPIINKRGRIIGYKKVDPAQVSKKDDLTISSTSQNAEMSEFNKRRNELILQKKYGGTGRPITVGDKTYNPGDDGYLETFNMIQGVMSRSGAIVPISRETNNLEMTNKTDRPTIIFSGAGSSSSGSSTMSSSGGSTDIQDFKKSDNTMNKIQTLILET